MLFESSYSYDESSNDCDDRHDVTDICSLLHAPRGVEVFNFIFACLNASFHDTQSTFFMHLAREISIILIQNPTVTL